jgi:hypothetical protein
MSVLNYVTDDTRDALSLSDDGPEDRFEDSVDSDSDARDQEWLDNYFDRLEVERGTDDSDAYVCEGWDEPNYISADHAFYPDLSSWQTDPEVSLTGK